MVLKISISLPGETLITLEATEAQIFSEVVSLALKELPKDLLRIQMAGPTIDVPENTGKNVTASPPDSRGKGHHGNGPVITEPAEPTSQISNGEEAYATFCDSISPLGDMRRVVVVAEGARRFLGMESVSEGELGRLFDLAGWRPSGDFLQTLRNAARSKFRWLERVPGSTGYYSVTPTGRDNVTGAMPS